MDLLRKDTSDPYINYPLKSTRMNRGISARDLSRKAGIVPCTLYAYERLRCFPSKEVALRIATYLGKSVDYLFPESLREFINFVRRENSKLKTKKIRLEERTNNNFSKMNLENGEEDIPSQADKYFICESVNCALKLLDPKERQILSLRYGLGDLRGETSTLKQVADKFGVPRERIRQLENKTLGKLKWCISKSLSSYFD